MYVAAGTGYRDDHTSGIATGDAAEGEYAILDGTHYNSGCCFDYGNAETNNDDNGRRRERGPGQHRRGRVRAPASYWWFLGMIVAFTGARLALARAGVPGDRPRLFRVPSCPAHETREVC